MFIQAPKASALPEGFSRTQVISSGLNDASGFEFAPDGRIFILERTGAVKIYKDGGLLQTPFTTFSSVASGDRGLIGIAFDPNFATNHYVYFYYTNSDLLNYLVRFDASGDVATAPPTILFQTTVPSNLLHVGGSVRFGLDDKLYFAVGDNGYPPNAQDLSVPFGKIMRINRDGSTPADNPFVGQAGTLPQIWAYGLRNPWRFQFDSANGRLYSGDVGNDTWEEVNLIVKGGNYGWPLSEGTCTQNCTPYLDPVYTYNHDGQSSAVTGGPVYRGDNFPAQYQGRYFYSDYARGFINQLILNEDGTTGTMVPFDPIAGSVVDLKVGPDGSLWYVTYYPGRLYRVTFSGTNQVPSATASSNGVKGVEPLNVQFSSAGSSDPEGQPLSYLWNFGDGTTSTEPNPNHTFSQKGVYTVNLSVSDGENTNQAVPIVIQVGLPPTVIIAAPTDNSNYLAGQSITFNVFANDAAGFDINDGDIKTDVILHHDTHTHPFLDDMIGRSGTFVIPNTGEASADTWYEVRTTATDTNGLATSKSVFIYPRVVEVTMTSNVPGVQLYLDGTPHTAPYTFDGVSQFRREISAPATTTVGGVTYNFTGWSDGGARTHTYITPNVSGAITATYAPVGSTGSDSFEELDSNGNPIGYSKSAWGDNTTTFGLSTDAHTGERSGSIVMSNYQNGDARWYLNPQSVTGGTEYIYSVWYKSSLPTKLVGEVTHTDGSKSYEWLGILSPSADWKLSQHKLTMPATAQSVVVYQYLNGNGWLQVDGLQLAVKETPPPAEPENLIPNGSIETIGMDGLPANWNSAAWGSQTVTHSLTTGRNSTFATRTEVSNYISGNAKWITAAIPVTPGEYHYHHYFRSSITSKAIIDVTLSDGTHAYIFLGQFEPTANWTEVAAEIALPAGAVSMRIEHYIEGNGWIETDDFSMTSEETTTEPEPTGGNVIQNGDLENREDDAKPTGWNAAAWGNNVSVASIVAGRNSSTATRVELTNYESGNAKWLSPVCSIAPGTYHFTSWYRSNATSKLIAEVTLSDGTKQYIWLGQHEASEGWVQIMEHVEIPAGAASIRVEQYIESNGWLETDDYSLAPHQH